MADTNSQVQYNFIQFSINWAIKWAEFAKLSSSSNIKKNFITSYNNVPLLWEAALSVPSIDSPAIGFFLYYLNGPMEKLGNVEYEISIVKPDLSMAKSQTAFNYEAKQSDGRGWDEYFDEKDPVAIRAKYELKESDPLSIRITLKIPIAVFSYSPIGSPPATPPNWMTDLFADIQDPRKSVFWNAKLISRDGIVFYCHKVIAYQSVALQEMFNHPPADGRPENEYEFPQLDSTSLKALVQFLHTGQVDLVDLTTKDLIELADAAEMYKLKPLKEACAVVLWKKVADNPDSCAQILRFAYLNDDLKDLKHRAMDVFAENYELLSAEDDMVDGFFRDKRLHKEFLLFMSRRLSVEKKLAG